MKHSASAAVSVLRKFSRGSVLPGCHLGILKQSSFLCVQLWVYGEKHFWIHSLMNPCDAVSFRNFPRKPDTHWAGERGRREQRTHQAYEQIKTVKKSIFVTYLVRSTFEIALIAVSSRDIVWPFLNLKRFKFSPDSFLALIKSSGVSPALRMLAVERR